VGGILTDTATIEWTYDDATPQITACTVSGAGTNQAKMIYKGYATVGGAAYVIDHTSGACTLGSASLSASISTGCALFLGWANGFIEGYSGDANWNLYAEMEGTTEDLGKFYASGVGDYIATIGGVVKFTGISDGNHTFALEARKWSTGGSLNFGGQHIANFTIYELTD